MIKSIYLKETFNGAFRTLEAYATLSNLCREMGLYDRYKIVQYHIRKHGKYTMDNVSITKLKIKRK